MKDAIVVTLVLAGVYSLGFFTGAGVNRTNLHECTANLAVAIENAKGWQTLVMEQKKTATEWEAAYKAWRITAEECGGHLKTLAGRINQ